MAILYVTHSIQSQCSLIGVKEPPSNFFVLVTTPAAAFNTRCNLSVVTFGELARKASQ